MGLVSLIAAFAHLSIFVYCTTITVNTKFACSGGVIDREVTITEYVPGTVQLVHELSDR